MAIENWNIDTTHSTVGFTVRHLMISKVHGLFTKWNGKLSFDEQNPANSSVEAAIEMTSIDTRDEKRDGHLKSGDFFETDKFPQMTFKSTKVEAAGASQYKVHGELTLRGVTKPVTLDAEFAGRQAHPQGGERAGFSAHTAINRKDFGMVFNQILDNGGVGISDKVDINIEIEAMKAA